MRFQLPQFIETQVKLVGPLTLRQFLWVAFGAVLLYILYLTLPGYFFIVLALPLAAIFMALAFLDINGAPLSDYAVYAFNYLVNPKKYVYKKKVE
ncbi:MAG: hypothetical protein A3J46_05900 [Candidatus Yanofskybacteria bacterium RIFCSPHIGHO2_02_FULL_41_11]|uniref:PrgI family protein n=1 Tax=Candidatus Yanofskybacteria bacterium RIFCSPHIGHO2_02_FULL_41_11 TaxID=1802675 RepID=A0A1F8F770_9BACT|nr:MAG: hypothetical protein A3J46_05900 [Candidatus Yanofskybacteria bacterium RIFCSPHIGHO2_02_FULL_41_11]